MCVYRNDDGREFALICSEKIQKNDIMRNEIVKPSTLRELFSASTARWPDNRFASDIAGEHPCTYSEFKDKVLTLSSIFCRYGIMGDTVAILSENKPNWTVAFFAAAAFGRVAVPILPASSGLEVGNIIGHSEARALVVSSKQLLKIDRKTLDRLDLVIDIDTLSVIRGKQGLCSCSQAETIVPEPDDLAAIIYTSGTSGRPKGVMLSHRNLCHNIVAGHHAQPVSCTDRWLSILPMAHAYELALGVLLPMSVGACVWYIDGQPSPSVLMPAMASVRPTIMLTVPLIIEKIHKAMMRKVAASPFLSWMKEHVPFMLNRLLGSRLLAMTGGCLRFFGIGGAKLNPEVEKFLKDVNFPYAIGYGLTETAPLVCNACVGKTRVGSIGVPAFGVEVRLNDVSPDTGEGEIMVRGDNVMLGYFRDPDLTAEVIDEEGWFHTGDLAAVDADGIFFVRGRLKNVLLNAAGENIYPEDVEAVLNTFPGVDESLVVMRGNALVALVRLENDVRTPLANICNSIREYVNRRVNRQSNINSVEIISEPFKKTATSKIRRFLYITSAA